MLKRLLLGIVLSLFCITSFATKMCTGYIVSKNGYIVTAGHCAGKKITVFYWYKNQLKYQQAVTVGKESGIDVMLIKIQATDLKYFMINSLVPVYNQNIMYIGYPNPGLNGKGLHFFYGKVINDFFNRYFFNRLEMSLYSGPGASGAPVIDSNGLVVGTLVAAIDLGGYSFDTFAEASAKLLKVCKDLVIKLNVVSVTGCLIDAQSAKILYQKNKQKIVLIFID